MLRALLRLLVVAVIVVGLGAFFLGYRWAGGTRFERTEQPVATTGSSASDDTPAERARQTGAEIGERVAAGARDAERALSEAGFTAKIKSKIALDDTLNDTRISVETSGSTVTLTGTVRTEAQHQRALQLARETSGVTSVLDRLTIQRP